MGKKFDIFYFSSTHWDREWYQDFQGFRYRLVKMADKLLDLFDKDVDYKTFHFDGQTIVLEDYTEICPEKKERLAQLIKERKILIGPWYVMPDEFLLSGESLIRNLMIGHRICDDWGTKPWKYGYVCDIFGHIAQMPQIFNGFDIKYSTLGRGTTEKDPAFFRWQSPDGSECLNFRLSPENGYGQFWGVYNPVKNKGIDNPEIVERIKAFVDDELRRSDIPIVIVMDGVDHADASVHTTDYIKKMAELYPDATVHHVNLCEQGELLEQYRESLPVIAGELNKTTMELHSYLHLITNTLSSYYTIKKQNDECQNLLEKSIEPMMVMAELDGIDLKQNFVKRAYKYLIQNHPHDSICGCSIDQVHKDMEYRFDQVKEICTSLYNDFRHYSSLLTAPENGEKYENILVLNNFFPYDIDKTITVDLDFDLNYPAQYQEPFGYEKINSFKIYDECGAEIPYQVIEIKRNYLYYGRKDMHTVTFRAKIPACGTAQYKIVPHTPAVRYLEKIKAGMNYAENEHIRVDILSNGSLKITDKKTGKAYSQLGNLVDDGEIGDGWYHTNPVNDSAVSSCNGSCTVEKVEHGPSRCVFKVTRELIVPEEMIEGKFGKHRSEKTVTLKFVAYVGLSEENRFVDVKMSYENIAKDHRLRMVIPTGINTDTYFSGQAFYCCERKVGIDYSTQDWCETDQYEKATNGIFGKRDESGCGIAFVAANGLHECAAYDDEDGSLCVTLSRSFKTTAHTNGETRCQLNLPLEYNFILAPIDSDIAYNDILKMQDSLATNVMTSFKAVPCGTQPSEAKSRMSVGGKNIAVSIIKRPEDGSENAAIVRVFNASGDEADGFIRTERVIEKAELTNLNEEKISDMSADKNELKFTLSPWKIATYKLYYKN